MDRSSYRQVLDQLQPLGTKRRHRQGENVFHPGEPARAVYYLLTEGQPPGELRLECSLTHWAAMLELTREALSGVRPQAVLMSQFPIPNSQLPIPNSQFPIPNSQFPIP
jgi:hypothetical protein